MCWITFSPAEKRIRKLHAHHQREHHHHHSDHGSSVEELVRISHPTVVDPSYSNRRIRISTPAIPVIEDRHHDHSHHLHPHGHHHHHHPHLHHLHPHMHPLHHHPIKLYGPGRKRAPPPGPPPPSPNPSRCTSRTREPIYRTQIVEPRTREVRETTRIALREARPERGRLRRVAGYEVLGREVPWSWDCVSSVADSGRSGRGDRTRGEGRKGSLRFPPFGGAGSWM